LIYGRIRQRIRSGPRSEPSEGPSREADGLADRSLQRRDQHERRWRGSFRHVSGTGGIPGL